MTPEELHNQLFAGKRVTLAFETYGKLASFRASFYRFKKDQDVINSVIGDTDGKQMLSFKVEKRGDKYIAVMQYKDRQPLRGMNFEIVSIDDGPDNNT